MLLVKTKLGPSTIHGIGLFADEFIAKGTRYWEVTEGWDRRFAREDIEKLPRPAAALMLKHTYTDKHDGLCVLCDDDARFVNHADDPNTIEVHAAGRPAFSAAARDIEPGEEITCDYRTFDAAWREKLGENWPAIPHAKKRIAVAA